MRAIGTTALVIVPLVLSGDVIAQKHQSDNTDGSYTNPVLAADFPLEARGSTGVRGSCFLTVHPPLSVSY